MKIAEDALDTVLFHGVDCEIPCHAGHLPRLAAGVMLHAEGALGCLHAER